MSPSRKERLIWDFQSQSTKGETDVVKEEKNKPEVGDSQSQIPKDNNKSIRVKKRPDDDSKTLYHTSKNLMEFSARKCQDCRWQ